MARLIVAHRCASTRPELDWMQIAPHEWRTPPPAVGRIHPHLMIAIVAPSAPWNVDVDIDAWLSDDFDSWAFDRGLDGRIEERFHLCLSGRGDALCAELPRVLSRCQRLFGLRNDNSSTSAFDRLCELHRSLHDLSMPLVRADYDHALDTQHWTLRLEPSASLELQAAALLHDIERLASEATERHEHLAGDYQEFKDRHARAGATVAAALLDQTGFSPATIERIQTLIASHESPEGTRDLATLNAADALSFLSLNSPGYFDYFGHAQGKKKLAFTLSRLLPEYRRELESIHLRPDVVRALVELADESGSEAVEDVASLFSTRTEETR